MASGNTSLHKAGFGDKKDEKSQQGIHRYSRYQNNASFPLFDFAEVSRIIDANTVRSLSSFPHHRDISSKGDRTERKTSFSILSLKRQQFRSKANRKF